MIPIAPQLLDSHGDRKLQEMKEDGPLPSQLLSRLSLALSPKGRKPLLPKVLMGLGVQPQEGWP